MGSGLELVEGRARAAMRLGLLARVCLLQLAGC